MSEVPNYNPTGDYKNDLTLLKAALSALKANVEELQHRVAVLESKVP